MSAAHISSLSILKSVQNVYQLQKQTGKWYNCLNFNKFLWQIILYYLQKRLSSQHGWLSCVSL